LNASGDLEIKPFVPFNWTVLSPCSVQTSLD